MDFALRSLIGLVRGPSMMIAGLAAATAAAGALVYTVSIIRSAGAADAELAYLAQVNRDNAALVDASKAATRDARTAEIEARRGADELRARIRAAARAASAGQACGLNDSVREAIESWRVQ